MIDPTSVTLHTSGGENHGHSETASAGDQAYKPCGTLGTANKIGQENKCKQTPETTVEESGHYYKAVSNDIYIVSFEKLA